MKKKNTLTAQLEKKGGRYYAIFRYPSYDGTRKAKWYALHLKAHPGNKREALNKMEEMKRRLQDLISVPGFEIGFSEYLRKWIETKKGKIEESTFNSFVRLVEGKILPFFKKDKLALSEVKPKHIRDLYEHLYLHGNKSGDKGLSISSIKSVKHILHAVFCQAIIEGLIRTNPTESVALPAKDNPRKHHNVLDIESANRLLGYVQDDTLMYPLLLLTLRYGLRKSEVLGIKWNAIDFDNNLFRIESVIVAGKHQERDRTKTETSRRSFLMFPEVKEAFLIRKREQERQKETLGDAYFEPIYVFTKPNGDHLNPYWVTREFQTVLEECGLPPMRFHDLRHSTACILYDNGMELLELQRWMRHGKLSMTSDVYLHISEKHEKQMADKINNMLEDAALPEKDTSQFTIENLKLG